jgi:hypothetical protein
MESAEECALVGTLYAAGASVTCPLVEILGRALVKRVSAFYGRKPSGKTTLASVGNCPCT